MNQSLQNHIEQLSLGIRFFEDPQNKGRLFITANKKEYSEEDIRALSFFVLQDFLPDYKLYTEEDFATITLERFELDLGRLRTEIGNKEVSVPTNINEMVANMERDKAKVAASITKRQQELHKFSVAINTAVAKVGDPDYPNPEEAAILIEVAQNDKERLIDAISAKVQNKEAANTYVAYAATTEPGQIVAKIDPQKVAKADTKKPAAIISIGREIGDASKLVALGVAYSASDNKQYLKEESQKPVFKDSLRTEIKNNNPDATQQQIDSIVEEYTAALTDLKPNEPVPAINSNDLTVIYLPPVSKSASVAKNSFGDKTQIFNLALASSLSTAPLPVIPMVETPNAQIASGTADVIKRFYGEAGTATYVANIVMPETAVGPETLPAYGGFLLPVAAAYSGKEVAKTNPGQATANNLYLVNGIKLKDFERITQDLNLSHGEALQIKEQLRTLEKAFPTYQQNLSQVSLLIIGQRNRAQISESQIKEIVTGNGNVYENYVQQTAPIGSFAGMQNLFANVGNRLLGRVSDNFLERAIRTNVAEKVIGKVATSAAGKAATSFIAKAGLALTALGEFVSTAIPIIGPIITLIASKVLGWIATQFAQKVVPWLRDNAGYILGFLGAGGALALGFGGVGVVVGGVGGLALGGAISGTGAGAAVFVFLGALLGFLVAALIVPVLIVLIGIPILTAFILFIINASAYVVPPATSLSSGSTNGPIYPAVSCFVFKGDWSPARRDNATQSINFLLTNTPDYINALCKAYGTMTLNSTTLSYGWGFAGGPGGQIDFDLSSRGGAFLTFTDGLYLLAHEAGHKFARANGNIYAKFSDTPGVGDVLPCTYPLATTFIASESFAESIADYVSNSPMSPGPPPYASTGFSCLAPNFQQKYPNHWKFVHENVIKETLGWPGN